MLDYQYCSNHQWEYHHKKYIDLAVLRIRGLGRESKPLVLTNKGGK